MHSPPTTIQYIKKLTFSNQHIQKINLKKDIKLDNQKSKDSKLTKSNYQISITNYFTTATQCHISIKSCDFIIDPMI